MNWKSFWHFFGGKFSVLCAFFSSDISCRIPFSRFLSHFHYCNVLFLWCIVVRSLLLTWMERVADHLSSLPLTHSASTPEPPNGLQIDPLRVASSQRELNAACDWSCIEMKWNTYSYLVLSFAQIWGPLKCHPSWLRFALPAMLFMEYKKRQTWRRIPIFIFGFSTMPLRLALPSFNQYSFIKNLHCVWGCTALQWIMPFQRSDHNEIKSI